MSFACFTPVVKAKRRVPWKATRTRTRLDALADKMGSAMGLDLSAGVSRFKAKIDPQKVYQAWLSGNYQQVSGALPWQELYGDIEPSIGKLASAHEGAWDLSLDRLPGLKKNPHLRWDLQNPRVRDFIATRRAYNFTNLTESSAQNIRRWTSDSFSRALTPREVAAGIRNQIGLLPAHAVAVENRRIGLLNSGMAPARAEALSVQYADQLLDYRAQMIGRTETRLATNQGQMTVWRQAADQGLINRNTVGRRWITMGPDPCDICDTMDGRTVPLDSPWILDDGTPVDCPPDGTHPHCYCGFDIVYGDEAEEA